MEQYTGKIHVFPICEPRNDFTGSTTRLARRICILDGSRSTNRTNARFISEYGDHIINIAEIFNRHISKCEKEQQTPYSNDRRGRVNIPLNKNDPIFKKFVKFVESVS